MDINKMNIRGLTRGELKSLRKEGVRLGGLESLDEEKRDKALDKIFNLACPGMNADDLTPGEALELYTRIAAQTYITGEERKNSASPQPSVSGEKYTTVAIAEKTDSGSSGTARKSKKKHG